MYIEQSIRSHCIDVSQALPVFPPPLRYLPSSETSNLNHEEARAAVISAALESQAVMLGPNEIIF